MSYKSKELREQRAVIAQQMAELVSTAKKESRPLNSEERGQFDKMNSDVNRLLEEAEGYERIEKFEDQAIEEQRSIKSSLKNVPQNLATKEDRNKALKGWLAYPARGMNDFNDEIFDHANRFGLNVNNRSLRIPLFNQAPHSIADVEKRALSTGGPTTGGNLVADEAMAEIEKALVSGYSAMRQVSRIYRTSTGGDFPVPNIDDNANTGSWLSEGSENTGTTDPSYGQTVLSAHKAVSTIIRVSVEMLQDSNFNLEQHLGEIIGERLAKLTNLAYTTGGNSGEPNGVDNTTSLGHTTAAAASISFSDLLSAYHGLEPAYRANAVWMGHDSVLEEIRSTVDDDGRPLWIPSLQPNLPDTVFGKPFLINQDMTAYTGATGQTHILFFGDFKRGYAIRDVMDLTIVRSDDRYFEFHQAAFVAFMRTDGDSVAADNPVIHVNSGGSGS